MFYGHPLEWGNRLHVDELRSQGWKCDREPLADTSGHEFGARFVCSSC